MWSHSPPDPVPIGDEPAPRVRPEAPTPGADARPSRLLPVVQCLAEGGWLAVVAAAIQAMFGEPPIMGPLEFAVLAGIGMGWARRTRWRSPGWEAFGLPVIAVAAGAVAWLLAPETRIALVLGDLQAALSAHPGGWVAAFAVYRGHVHQAREVDEEVQDDLIRIGLPALGVAWLVGDLAARSNGVILHDAFTAMAFIGSLLFVAAGVLALGLARLAAVRGDGPGSGSWFGFALIVALGMTVVGVPAAVLLGVPLEALLVAAVAPIRIALALLVLVLSPVVLVAALLVDLARDFLPAGFGQGTLELPQIEVGTAQPTSELPGILFYLVVGAIILLELAAVALYLWWRWRERQEMAALLADVHEERSVVYDRAPRPPRAERPPAQPRRDRADPVAAYLLALDALASDGRWARLAAETPRQHVLRLGTADPPARVPDGLARLAAAYQLVRYAGRGLTERERARADRRLTRVEQTIRHSR
jgi:hypothetical protein